MSKGRGFLMEFGNAVPSLLWINARYMNADKLCLSNVYVDYPA